MFTVYKKSLFFKEKNTTYCSIINEKKQSVHDIIMTNCNTLCKYGLSIWNLLLIEIKLSVYVLSFRAYNMPHNNILIILKR